MKIQSLTNLDSKLIIKGAYKDTENALKTVENCVRSCLVSEAPILSDIAKYLLDLGGKRVRPLLCILSSRLFKMFEPSEALIDAAAGIEMIHMSTLLHDDIIDESPLRRHKESAYSKYGIDGTLLAGDFLLARAYAKCAKLDDFIVDSTERACVELTEGEILEGKLDQNSPCSIDQYLDVINKKTGSLFWLSTTVGSHLASAPADAVELAKKFGKLAGITFQIVDDILDITAGEDLLGKPAGTDLRQKTPSIVNINWLKSGDPKAKEFFSQDKPTNESAKEATKYLTNSEIIDKCRLFAKEYADKSNDTLYSIPEELIDNRSREQLSALVEYTLTRLH